MADHPSRNLFERLNVYLPWDYVEIGKSFFIPGASRELDESALRQAATRKGIRVSLMDTTESQGAGVRVKRVA